MQDKSSRSSSIVYNTGIGPSIIVDTAEFTSKHNTHNSKNVQGRSSINEQQPIVNSSFPDYGSIPASCSDDIKSISDRSNSARHDYTLENKDESYVSVGQLTCSNNSLSESNEELGEHLDDESAEPFYVSEEVSTTYLKEIKILLVSTLPLIFTFLLQNSFSLVSVYSISHLGAKELGGITLGTMTANITGFAAIQGFCTCLDTLCSQAHGAKNYRLVGILVQRCVIVALVSFLPIMYIWWFWSEPVLTYIIPDKELCHLAANYLKIISLGVPGSILFECGKRFLQCQGIFHASTIVLIVCSPLNMYMNYLFVWSPKFGIGYLGAPLSVAISYWLMAFGLLIYPCFSTYQLSKCWDGILKRDEIFRNWRYMFDLALPGIIMIEAEFMAFEILTVFASHISTVALDAQSIIASIETFAYELPFAVSVATSARVANLVGASLYKDCIISCRVALMLSVICSLFNMFIIFTFRNKIAGLFSKEDDIFSLVVSTLPLLASMQIVDSFATVAAGCLHGQGKQKMGGYINLIAFYVVGIPIACYLTFYHGFGVKGLWIGIATALSIMSMTQYYAIFFTSWTAILQAAHKRNKEGRE